MPASEPLVSDPADARGVRDAAVQLLARTTGAGWISPADAADLLQHYGLSLVGEVVDPAAAVRTAERLGLPVALKVADTDVVHRTERHLVVTGLATAQEVDAAAEELVARAGHSCRPASTKPRVVSCRVAGSV